MTPERLGAAEAARRIACGELACEALAEACLARIAAREPEVGAWAYIDPASAAARARALDAAGPGALLRGLPVGIKDVIDTADMPTSHGSPIWAGHRPRADAAAVAMLRRAGANVFGKTVTTEFATAHPAGTRNPLNLAHTPGGSSSGSAAAVADFMVPLAIGTQTGGSTLRPASFCGIVGYKPTFGLVNRTGVKPVSDSLDTVGLFGRSVDDVALLAAALTGCPELAAPDPAKPRRIGVWRGPEWAQAAPEAGAAVEAAAGVLAAAGVAVADVHPPADFEPLAAAHHDIEYFEMARGYAWERDRHADLLSETFRARLAKGEACSLARYAEAQGRARACRAKLDALLRDYDLLLTASAPGEAPEGLSSTGSAAFNSRWTLLHAPCIGMPGGSGPRGLPVGVQCVGRRGADAALLAAAAWIEARLAGRR